MQILREFLNAFWLRPEVALIKTHEYLALKQLHVNEPSLDIGCGDGRNTVFLNQCGFETYGTEISKEIVDKTKDNLSKLAVVVSLETKDDSDIVKSFGKQLAMHVAASNPLALESNLIDKETIDKEVSLITEELKNSGKPEEIAKKISLGKINKFKEENSLLSQAWVMEPKKKVQDILKELAINDLKIKDFYRLKIGE